MDDIGYLKIKKLQEQQAAADKEASELKQTYLPEAYAGMMEDLNSVLPQPEMELIEQVNQDATSPYLEKKPERGPASTKPELDKTSPEAPKPEAPKPEAPMDPQSEYAKLIEQYKAKLAEPEKKAGFMQYLPGLLAAAHDTHTRARGSNVPLIGKIDIAGDYNKSTKAKRREDLSGLQNLQSMYQKYMDMNKKEDITPYQKESLRLKEKELGLKEKKGVGDKPITKGQEAVDRAFAKDYNDFAAQGGIASIQKNISKLENAKSLLTKKGGPNLTGGVLGPTPDFIKNVAFPESISVRDDVESVIQQSLRQILGGQFAEKEAERLIQRSYNENLDEATNAKRLQGTIDELKTMAKAKEDAAKYFEEKGTLQGFKAKMNKVVPSKKDATKVKVQAPDGRVGYIPQDKIEAFLSKHPEAKVLE